MGGEREATLFVVCWRRRRGYIGAREGTILEEERSLR
jgi:hypothetical protein